MGGCDGRGMRKETIDKIDDIIKMNFKKTRYGVDCIKLAQHRDKRQAVVERAFNLRFP